MDEGPCAGDVEDGVFRLLIPLGETEFSEAALTDESGKRWRVVNRGLYHLPMTHLTISASRIPGDG
jgi:hypothetical protein